VDLSLSTSKVTDTNSPWRDESCLQLVLSVNAVLYFEHPAERSGKKQANLANEKIKEHHDNSLNRNKFAF
jgi:hypothetical protein